MEDITMDPIKFNPQTRVFTLRTRSTMYQMQIERYDTLVHLYYGANLGDAEIGSIKIGRAHV